MAKETKDVKLYRYFELVEIRKTPRKRTERPIEDRIDHVPVAIFDDRETLELYTNASGMQMGATCWAREEYTEQEPKAENFSLPFNPTYVKPEPVEAPAEEVAKAE